MEVPRIVKLLLITAAVLFLPVGVLALVFDPGDFDEAAEKKEEHWIVVQKTADGVLQQCWTVSGKLRTGVCKGPDAICWKTDGGHKIHVSSPYLAVEVDGEPPSWSEALETVHLSQRECAMPHPENTGASR